MADRSGPATPPLPSAAADAGPGLARAPELIVAAVYRREIGASAERVWENVYDWEHLPWLHREAFASIECHEAGDWGWRAQIGFHDGGSSEIELLTDSAAGRYVTRTLSGVGAPSEIWTRVSPQSPDRTEIEVEFCIGAVEETTRTAIGAAYTALYTRLWDEDEEMMQERAAALAGAAALTGPTARKKPAAPKLSAGARSLGPAEQLRKQLPLRIDWKGRPFRIVEEAGAFLAHSAVCPHWLGPLDECAIVDGTIVCPWHGYAFDVETGESADGRRMRLARAPQLRIEAASGEVWLEEGEDSPAV